MTIWDGEIKLLWEASDLVLLLFAVMVIQNLLFLLVWAFCKKLEQRMSMCHIRGLLKAVLWYTLLLLPVIAGAVMFKATYDNIKPMVTAGMEDAEWFNKMTFQSHKLSFSAWTDYGNHWIFILLLGLWIAGILMRGILPYLKESCWLKRLKNTGAEPSDSQLVGMVRRLEMEIGLRKPVKILENELLPEPFVTGCFCPWLYFPGISLEEQELELLVRHELIHCRRRDSFYRRLLCLLCGLYWFNPFMYAFARYFVEASEMACDEEVLQNCPSGARKRYAELLVAFSGKDTFLKQAVALTGYTESGLERRLKNMLKREKKRNKWSTMVIMAITMSICPLMTVSASYGVSTLQDMAVEMTYTDVEEEMNGGNTLTEQVDYVVMDDIQEVEVQILGKSNRNVDIILNGKIALSMGKETLKKGDKMTFAILGDNSTDQFRAGYKDSTGKRTYVSTSDGEINYTFTMQKADTYEMFIEGTSSKTVHVEGAIIIKSN